MGAKDPVLARPPPIVLACMLPRLHRDLTAPTSEVKGAQLEQCITCMGRDLANVTLLSPTWRKGCGAGDMGANDFSSPKKAHVDEYQIWRLEHPLMVAVGEGVENLRGATPRREIEGNCSGRKRTPGISSRLMRWRRWVGTTSGSGEVTFPSRRAWILRCSCWLL